MIKKMIKLASLYKEYSIDNILESDISDRELLIKFRLSRNGWPKDE